MTDILENTTAPLTETATVEAAATAENPVAQASTAEPAPDTVTPPPVEAAPISADVATVEHKAEQDTHHALSHLEAEAKAIFVTLPENEVKALLAWIAGKL